MGNEMKIQNRKTGKRKKLEEKSKNPKTFYISFCGRRKKPKTL